MKKKKKRSRRGNQRKASRASAPSTESAICSEACPTTSPTTCPEFGTEASKKGADSGEVASGPIDAFVEELGSADGADARLAFLWFRFLERFFFTTSLRIGSQESVTSRTPRLFS